jgi:hypothetical protein
VHPRENDLIVGTLGRSLYILADVTPLEHLSAETLAQTGAVFPIRPTSRWAQRGDWPCYGATYSAPNPPRGAIIRYYLRDEVDARGGDNGAAGGFALTISDATGRKVRRLEAPGSAGINEVVWDWRQDRPYEPAAGGRGGRGGGGGGGGGGRGGGVPDGPIVLPGIYTVSMEAGGRTHSSTVEVIADPRRPMTQADRTTRQTALESLHVVAVPINDATQAAQRLGEQLDAAEALIDAAVGAPESLATELAAIREELEAVEAVLGRARQNAGVASAIQGSSTRPTEDHLWQVDHAWELMPGVVERVNALVRTRVPALNARLYAEGVRPSPGATVTMPSRPRR